MNRTTRKRAVRAVAPVAGLLAAGLLVWQGSYAAFNATTDNTGDAWSTGTMVLTNNGGTAIYAGSTSALFSEANLNFGATGTKCITVESGGSIGGGLRLYRGALTGNATLAGQVRLTIDAATLALATDNVASNCTGFPTTGVSSITSATALPSFASTYAGGANVTVPNATTRVAYRIAWTLVTTGSTSGDNALQGATAGANLNWEIQ